MIELNKENFEQEIIKYKGKVVVDCWANWCGVCKMMKPKYQEIADSHQDIKFCTLEVDNWPEFAEEQQISNLPTIIIYEDGKVVNKGGFDVLEAL